MSAGAEIRHEREVAAPADTVHRLLTSVEAWPVWSPHIRRVVPPSGAVGPGWRGRVTPRFAPVATEMAVTWAEPGRGMDWETRALGHRLRYEQRITPTDAGCRVLFRARVEGPAGALLTRLAAPVSGLGQRRRLRRLAALAELQAALEAGAP